MRAFGLLANQLFQAELYKAARRILACKSQCAPVRKDRLIRISKSAVKVGTRDVSKIIILEVPAIENTFNDLKTCRPGRLASRWQWPD